MKHILLLNMLSDLSNIPFISFSSQSKVISLDSHHRLGETGLCIYTSPSCTHRYIFPFPSPPSSRKDTVEVS
jgi:hypothetical protein